MSKSDPEGMIDPMVMIDEYGTDALRPASGRRPRATLGGVPPVPTAVRARDPRVA